MIKAVIFDLDNTLYDYDVCNSIAEEKLSEKISYEFNIEAAKARKLLENAKSNIKKNLGNEVAASHNRLLYMQNICEQLKTSAAVHAMGLYDVYWDSMLSEMKLFGYVRPLMEELKKRKIKIGILTDMTAHIQYRKLGKLDLLGYIDYITTSEKAGIEKPAKKIFSVMLEKIGIAPCEAVMVGDSKAKDVEGAENVGIKWILYHKGMDAYSKVLEAL